jgi:hypothetical protein
MPSAGERRRMRPREKVVHGMKVDASQGGDNEHQEEKEEVFP